MNCKKCGNPLNDGVKFCPVCGEPVKADRPAVPEEPVPEEVSTDPEPAVQENPTEEKAAEEEKNTGKKKKSSMMPLIIIASVAALIVLIGGSAAMLNYISPSSVMGRAIKSGDYDKAWAVYSTRMAGKPLNDKNAKMLIGMAENILDACEDGSRSTTDAYSEVLSLGEFYAIGFEDEELSESFSETYQDFMDLKTVNDLIQRASEAMKNTNYEEALTYYRQAEDIDPNNEALLASKAKAADAYRTAILQRVDECEKEGAFSSSKSWLERGLAVLEKDEILTQSYNELEAREKAYIDAQNEKKIDKAIQAADEAARGGDWDKALQIITDKQEDFPDSQKLKKTYDDLRRKMPITLKNLTMVSSESVSVQKSVQKDRWGNVYDGGVIFSEDGRALYNLNKEFTKFTGTLAVTPRANNSAVMSISIYLDDKLVQYYGDMTVDTPPTVFEIDVTGATTMRIVMESNNWYSYVLFGDTNFAKAQK